MFLYAFAVGAEDLHGKLLSAVYLVYLLSEERHVPGVHLQSVYAEIPGVRRLWQPSNRHLRRVHPRLRYSVLLSPLRELHLHDGQLPVFGMGRFGWYGLHLGQRRQTIVTARRRFPGGDLSLERR